MRLPHAVLGGQLMMRTLLVAGAVQGKANQLVEEFMLAANMAAAGLVSRAFPERALLRRHPPPHQRKMDELAATASRLVQSQGVPSPGRMQCSLWSCC